MSEKGRARRLAAILAADVVGYSRLMQEDDEAALDTLQRYRGVIRRLDADHRRLKPSSQWNKGPS